ncbi:MAG: phytoene/squalene synthase family protein [Roseiflexaceae bacterium]
MTLQPPDYWPAPAHAGRLPRCEAAALLAALLGCAGGQPAGTFEPTRPALALADAYRLCGGITRRHSRSFFLSSQFLPAEKRRAIRALYAFCRTSDNIVDDAGGAASRALARWVALVQAPRPPSDDSVLLAWHDTAVRYRVPRALVDELLAGLAMDLLISRYPSFEDLWLYCYRVASVVGLITMRIIGHQQGAAPYAVRLGVALQLTNILRDVGEDAARGRIYLPQEDLARFGLCDDDILSRRGGGRFRALMRFEVARAHALYEAAWPGIALLSADSRFAVGAAAEIYRGILDKIVANDYDVFARRAQLSLIEKLLLLRRVQRRLDK